jgi:hypothetical protein
MKAKRSNRDEVRENSLNVPMTIIEKDQVRKAADSMGVSMSTFARIALDDYMRKIGAKK